MTAWGHRVRWLDTSGPVAEPTTLAGPDEARGLAFDGSGKRMAVAWGNGRADVLDVASLRLLRSVAVKRNLHSPLAFSPDGRLLASVHPDGSRARVQVHRLDDPGGPILLASHSGVILCLAFSPDSLLVASGGNGGSVAVSDVARGEDILQLRDVRGALGGVAFSPDGELIAAGAADQVVHIWEARSGRIALGLNAGNNGMSTAFSPDGRHLAVGSSDGPVHLFELTGRRVRRLLTGLGDNATTLAFRPGFRQLVSAALYSGLVAWDTSEARCKPETIRPNVFTKPAMVSSPDGRWVAFGGSDIHVVDLESGGDLRQIATGQLIRCLAAAPGGRRLAVGAYQGVVTVWDVVTGRIAWKLPASALPTSLAYVEGGRSLLVVRDEGAQLSLHDAETGAAIRQAQLPGGIARIVAAPGGNRAYAAGTDGTLTDLSLPGLTTVTVAKNLHLGRIGALDVSGDGRLVVTGGEDGRAVISDAATLRPLVEFRPGTGGVSAAALDSTGSLLALADLQADVIL
jgi:WD40 repeat protein